MRILFFDIGEIDYKGIEILSAVLKENGHTVDLVLDPGFGKHYYFKIPILSRIIPDKLLIEKIKKFKPDIIGMSIVTNNFKYFKDIGIKIKKTINVPIIVGGIHPTSVPEEVIKESWVDILCVGDGEESFLELLKKMELGADYSDVKNLWVKDSNGNISKNPLRPLIENIDLTPFPDRSIYAQYGALTRRIRVMTSRGCVHNCSFCVNSFRNDLYPDVKYLRKRSVANVISELELIKDLYKPSGIRFEDDVFVLDRNWLIEFKEEYIKKINLPFHCYFTPNGVKSELIAILKECGCDSIAMGVQSGNAELRRKIMNRYYSNEKVLEAANIIKNAGIKLYAEFMFGLPSEEPENMWETLELSEQMRSDNTWTSTFYPYPKTSLTDYCLENDYLDEKNYNKIISGEGSPQSYTILNHQYAEEAYKFKALLPLYNSLPKFLRPALKRVLKMKYGFFHRLLFFISIPLLEKKEFFYRAIRMPSILYKTRKILKQK